MTSATLIRNGFENKYKFISKEEIIDMQNQKLKEMIKKVSLYHPYYRKKFKELGLEPGDIQTIEDLSKLPFTTKYELSQNPRDFVIQPTPEQIKNNTSFMEKFSLAMKGKEVAFETIENLYKPSFMVATSGRTSTSTPVFFSKNDLEYFQDIWAKDALIKGISKDDVYVSLFPYAPHLAFWITFFATKELGLFGVDTGGTLGLKRQIDMVQEMNASWISGMPSYVYYFLQQALKSGANFSNLRGITTGGEKLPDGLRKNIENLVHELGGKGENSIRDGYGIVEAKGVSMECTTGSGYHSNPETIIWEVVDEKTGENLGYEEKGSVAITHISGNGTILLRYLLGDTVEGGLTYQRCPHCGLTLPRIMGPIGRSEEYTSEFQITKIKGTTVNLNSLQDFLSQVDGILDYAIVIKKRDENDPYSLDDLMIHITPSSQENDKDGLKSYIKQEVKSQTEVTPKVEFVDKESLYNQVLGDMKGQKIVDQRKQLQHA